MKNILVTGGAGFIGSHVVDKLRQRELSVRVYDLRSALRSDVESRCGDLSDLPALQQAMDGVDAVIHLAAVADVKDVLQQPLLADAVNVRGTINVLEAARHSPGVQRVIYASTTWVYNECEPDHVDEQTLLGHPSHLYTATKLAGEQYCQAYSRLYDLPVTILRYGIPYGPRARDGAVIPIFVGKALRGEPLTIAGDGSQYRQFIYVEDLAEGNVRALAPVAANRIYNLDGDQKMTIRGIADTIRSLLGDVAIEQISSRPGDFRGKEVSSRRARDELGWQPSTSFEEGMRRYLDWYREHKATTVASR